ncbi:MAG: glutathione S-transferase family protein [Rhodospirillaceae bacterium]|nr:glutathione S-transferase family protein [Rhodospirillaceae bacterium]
MRTLYHLWLSPYCRKVRLVLNEKRLEHRLQAESVWDRRSEFLHLNPTGEVPVLVEADGSAISGSDAICEFLDEMHPEPSLIGRGALARAEVRRLVYWFDHKFNDEVTGHLVGEKIMKRFLGMGEPDSKKVRAGHANIHHHLDYITYLTDRRRWLGGDEISLADIAAAAHISTIDYLGDVPWNEHPGAKDWYARIKSRPSFRPLLEDHIPGAAPAKSYADLDF